MSFSAFWRLVGLLSALKQTQMITFDPCKEIVGLAKEVNCSFRYINVIWIPCILIWALWMPDAGMRYTYAGVIFKIASDSRDWSSNIIKIFCLVRFHMCPTCVINSWNQLLKMQTKNMGPCKIKSRNAMLISGRKCISFECNNFLSTNSEMQWYQ